jgi:cytochrome d ubiquinol oxidase subunit II
MTMPEPGSLVAMVIVVALIVYMLSGGADFGGGVWDLLARGPRAGRQRTLIAHAIGPTWEANHVWMILVLVLMFVAFPVGFAAIMTALHVPMLLLLSGVTLRGAAFIFRAYGPGDARWARWGWVFGGASAVTPVFLGVVLGAIVSGNMRLDAEGTVVTDFLSEWTQPFPWTLGAMTLALFSYLAAAYLVLEAEDEELRSDFRIRAIAANVAFGVTALVAALAARAGAPHLWSALAGDARAWTMQIVTAIVALAGMVAFLRRADQLGRALAVVQAVLVALGWATAQHGWVLPGALTVDAAAAPPSILWPVLVALGLGSTVLIPAFFLLYRVFKSHTLGRM